MLNCCYDLPIKDIIEVIQSECGFKMIDEVKVVDGYKEFPLEYITCTCNNNLIDYNQVDWLYDLYEVWFVQISYKNKFDKLLLV